MDGENNGKPYEQMDDLGGKPTIFGNTHKGPPMWSSSRDETKTSLLLCVEILLSNFNKAWLFRLYGGRFFSH